LNARWCQRANGGGTLKTFLDWVILVRALGALRGRMTGTAAVMAVGVHERTLERLASRLTGRTLATLRREPTAETSRRFSDWLSVTIGVEVVRDRLP
jgi:hypothetical protein